MPDTPNHDGQHAPWSALGGFDGVLVTFGDGADADTWTALFGHLAASAYHLGLTFKDGTKLTAVVRDWAISSGDEWRFRFVPVHPEHDAPVYDEPQTRRLSELVGIEIH